MSDKQQLHTLVDMLPETDCHTASRFLHFLVDEAIDEPLTEEDWQAIRLGQAEIARGEYTTLDELKRELNL